MSDSRVLQAPIVFLTTREIQDCLRVTPRTIYRLIESGELPAVRVGRRWRFRQSDLDDWFDRQRAAVRIS